MLNQGLIRCGIARDLRARRHEGQLANQEQAPAGQRLLTENVRSHKVRQMSFCNGQRR
jgi:hypothetical protein